MAFTWEQFRKLLFCIVSLKSVILLLLPHHTRIYKLNPVYLHLQSCCCRISVDEGKVIDNLDLLTRWCRDKLARYFAVDTFKRIFWKISLRFVPKGPIINNLALVQLMAWRQPGARPLSEPMMVTHKCVTRPQWIKYQSRMHTRQEHGHDYLHASTLVSRGAHCSVIKQTHCWQQSCTWFLLNCFLYFGWSDNVIQMTNENSRISQHFHVLTQAQQRWYLTFTVQGIGMRPANERRLYNVATSLIGWPPT